MHFGMLLSCSLLKTTKRQPVSSRLAFRAIMLGFLRPPHSALSTYPNTCSCPAVSRRCPCCQSLCRQLRLEREIYLQPLDVSFSSIFSSSFFFPLLRSGNDAYSLFSAEQILRVVLAIPPLSLSPSLFYCLYTLALGLTEM